MRADDKGSAQSPSGLWRGQLIGLIPALHRMHRATYLQRRPPSKSRTYIHIWSDCSHTYHSNVCVYVCVFLEIPIALYPVFLPPLLSRILLRHLLFTRTGPGHPSDKGKQSREAFMIRVTSTRTQMRND